MAVHKQMNESTGAKLRIFIALLHLARPEHRHRSRTNESRDGGSR